MKEQSGEILLTHAYQGVEFDWVACDAAGQLGYFSTAGFGPIPSTVLSVANTSEDVENLVRTLPVCTTAIVVSKVQHDITDWIRVAERGLFAFDWRLESAAYELIARPVTPAVAEDTATAIRSLSRQVLLSMNFATMKSIKVSENSWVAE